MGELFIRIKIADREYPIRTAATGEERLRKAGKEINEHIRRLREQFNGLDDKQDLLAMVTIHYAVEKLRIEEEHAGLQNVVSDKIDSLSTLLSSVL